MRKIIFSFLFFLFFISSVYAIANPSAVFCEEKGNEYIQIIQEDGSERGYCEVNGKLIEGWEYYRENKKTNIISESSIDKIGTLEKKSLSSTKSTFIFRDKIKEDSVEEINKESVIKAAPTSFDWRNYNGKDWTTPVKNQGDCGACWAFSSVSVIETRINKDLNNENYNADLSEQDIIKNNGIGNCGGGNEIDALRYIKNTGIVRESCMPYTQNNAGTICANGVNEKLKITNYARVGANAGAIKNIISTQGPVTVYMVVCGDFNSFSGSGVYSRSIDNDIYYDDSCWHDAGDGYEALNWHSVAIVGYTDSYWIVKNSWGTGWGDSGYIKIAFSQSVYDYDSWANAVEFDESGDSRVFFLDDSYYVTGTDIIESPVISSFTSSTSYNKSSVPISFSLNAGPKSLKYLSSVKINDISMEGNLQTGGIFTLSKTASEFGCTGETTCSLTANGTDDAGKTATSTLNVKIDDLVPRVTNFQMNNQSYFVNGSKSLTFNVKVEDAEIDSVKLNDIVMSRSGTAYSLTKTPSQLGCSSDGICFFNISAIDKIGNSNNSLYKSLYIDDIFPVINSIYLEKDVVQTGERVLVIVNATDNNNISSVTAEGVNLEKFEDLWKGNISLKSSPLEIIVSDIAENILTNISVVYSLDDVPPTLSSNLTYNSQTVSQNDWYNGDLNLSLNASDENEVSKIEWRFANQNTWNIYSSTLNFSENIEENKIIFRAIDEIGNIAPSKIINVKIDKNSPSIKNINLNSNKTNPSGEVKLFVDTFDNLSGIKEIKAIFNGNNYTDFEKINSKYEISLMAPSEEGIYTIILHVEDYAGNTNNGSIDLEVVENLPLVIPSIPSRSYIKNNQELIFTLINITNGTYQIIGQEIENITNETDNMIQIILNESMSSVIFNVSNMENIFYEEFSYSFDTTSPSFILENLPVAYDLNGTYKINFNCSDDESGVKNIVVYLRGLIVENLTKDKTFYNLDTLRLSNSNHTLKFACYDYSGNYNEIEINISVNNIPIFQSTQNGQVSFETSGFGNYVKTITSINSSEVELSLFVGDNIVITAPSDINQKLIYLNITASAQSKSKVYFSLSKNLLAGVDISKLKLWEKHEGDLIFKGPKSIILVEERESGYLFYFETDSYSEFIIGEQKITSLPPTNGGGGGGGGGGGSSGGSGTSPRGESVTKNIFMDEIKLKDMQQISLSIGEKINFRFSNQNNHTLIINNFNNESVNLTIFSEPINLTLFIGEEIKLNLTSSDYYDLYLRLEDIVYNKVNLTIQEINEAILLEDEEKSEIKSRKSINKLFNILGYIIGISLFLFVIYKLLNRKNKKNKNKKEVKDKDSKVNKAKTKKNLSKK